MMFGSTVTWPDIPLVSFHFLPSVHVKHQCTHVAGRPVSISVAKFMVLSQMYAVWSKSAIKAVSV